MLDQNTDRMWFVIGAVIVGAAIIFIANGSLPTLFASVADTFEGPADQSTGVIENMRPGASRPGLIKDNILDHVEILNNHWIHNENVLLGNGNPTAYGYSEGTSAFVSESIQVTPGSTYRITQPIELDSYTASFIAEYDTNGDIVRRPWNRNVSGAMEIKLSNNTHYIRYGAKSTTGKYVKGIYRLELVKDGD